LNQTTNLSKVEKDLVVSMDYTLFVDNEIVDSSEDGDPIEFIMGHGNIIPGLEKELYGMRPGDKKSVSVPAIEGYGEFDPDAVMEVSRTEFPAEIPMEVGVEISIENEDGEGTVAVIESFTDTTVTLNGNHPLAGKDLKFDIAIKGIRQPTAEELEHGHVHSDEDCDCDCEGEDCDCGENCDCGHDN
jgi:FKBP-type peptidyl-prolyl cis-trans isomerase SlyD